MSPDTPQVAPSTAAPVPPDGVTPAGFEGGARTFSRRIDCSDGQDDAGAGRARRGPARSDGPRRDSLPGGRTRPAGGRGPRH